MDLYELSCPKCGYKKRVLLGTQESKETLSDLNEDFAYYQLYYCPIGKEYHSRDTSDPEFDSLCEIHQVKMEVMSKLPQRCPKCDGEIIIKKLDLNTELQPR
ncbi:MAG: hypothetical protein ACXACA_07655 [Candidatus Ranarchaeia archaeon]|jgi:DNA-directed RNA polymerase subunit RPC12/RpoP